MNLRRSMPVLALLSAVLALSCLHAPPVRAEDIKAGPLTLSEPSIDLIVDYECGGKSYYISRLQRPTWPGGASGVTIGIGYDLGYNTRAQIAHDWSSLDADSVMSLQSVAGIKGQSARVLVARVRHVVVPWESAMRVFNENTVTRFAGLTADAFPALIDQHPHGQGALLSVCFNRGTSLEGESRREMRWIRHNLEFHPEWVPGDIRSMKRLWVGKGLSGLLRRRDAEAALFQRGLDSRPPVAVPPRN